MNVYIVVSDKGIEAVFSQQDDAYEYADSLWQDHAEVIQKTVNTHKQGKESR